VFPTLRSGPPRGIPALMGFRTDGSSHADGVQNEHDTIGFINANPDCAVARLIGEPIKHLGGTRNKSDAVGQLTNIGVSIKNHKGSGTFDWMNSSGASPWEAELKEEFKALVSSGVSQDEARKHINKRLSECLFSEDAPEFIQGVLSHLADHNCDIVLINDQKNRRYVAFRSSSIRDIFLSPVSITPPKKAGQTSTKINEHNIRARFVLNNGVGKLYEGKSSVPCLKLQQDQVAKFIASIPDCAITAY